MLSATISADVIASSSLSAGETERLNERILDIFAKINDYQRAAGKEVMVSRLVAGDTIECLIPGPNDALWMALILKSGIKSLKLLDPAVYKYTNERQKLRRLFEMYGVRIAVGIGDMDTNLINRGIFKGDAINISGRLISGQKTSNRERVTVKNTLFIGSVDDYHSYIFGPVLSLLDTLFNRMTSRQSEIVYMKLLELPEFLISERLGVSQSSVNQHSTAAGWNSIEEAVNLFSTFDFNTTFVPRPRAAMQ
jgi:hypothetical protein